MELINDKISKEKLMKIAQDMFNNLVKNERAA